MARLTSTCQTPRRILRFRTTWSFRSLLLLFFQWETFCPQRDWPKVRAECRSRFPEDAYLAATCREAKSFDPCRCSSMSLVQILREDLPLLGRDLDGQLRFLWYIGGNLRRGFYEVTLNSEFGSGWIYGNSDLGSSSLLVTFNKNWTALHRYRKNRMWTNSHSEKATWDWGFKKWIAVYAERNIFVQIFFRMSIWWCR